MKETKFVIVVVKRGVPDSVEAHDYYDIAMMREWEIRKDLNLNDDETGIFEIAV